MMMKMIGRALPDTCGASACVVLLFVFKKTGRSSKVLFKHLCGVRFAVTVLHVPVLGIPVPTSVFRI